MTPRTAGWAVGTVLVAAALVVGCAGPPSPGDGTGSGPTVEPRPEATTEAGRLQGIIEPGPSGQVVRYRGVPYAEAPVGDLRWAAPRRVQATAEVRDAATSGPACVQNAGQLPGPSLEEDCLYLDVTTPAAPPTEGDQRPVMVWIHGGSLETGTGAQYDAAELAGRGDVVVVTVNYRLGPMGFLALPGMDPTAGAQGLADQQEALRFVQRNAAGFGGDPTQVTVFGESGGGVSTCAHLVAPGSQGLFARAIVQSAVGACGDPIEPGAVGRDVPRSTNFQPRAVVEEQSRAAARRLGCPDPVTALACLRRLPPQKVLAEGAGLNLPAVGGPEAVLPAGPAAAIAAGRVAPVPVLQGVTSAEPGFFLAADALAGRPLPTAAEYESLVRRGWGADADRILAVYPAADYASPADAWVAVHSDGAWACPSQRLNTALAHRGPTYGYEFADPAFPTVPFPPGLTPGAMHGAEVPYLLPPPLPPGSPPLPALTAQQQRLTEATIGIWSTFARTGDPGTPAWTSDDRRLALLGEPGRDEQLTVTDRRAAHHCALWDDIATRR